MNGGDGTESGPPTATPAGRRKVELKIEADTARGVYANGTVVTRGRHEVILDFVSALPHHKPQVVSRVVLPRAQAEALARSLRRTLDAAPATPAPPLPGGGASGGDDPN